jgi:hypothetical protein
VPARPPQEEIRQYEQNVTTAMLTGLAPVAVLGYTASYLRLRWWTNNVRRRFRCARGGMGPQPSQGGACGHALHP